MLVGKLSMGGRAGGGGEDRGAAALRRAPKPARMSTGSIRTSVLCIALRCRPCVRTVDKQGAPIP